MGRDKGRGAGPEAADGPVRVPIEDRLDLHAFRPDEVPALVGDYVEEAARAGFRVVRIIHGKGTGVLRETVRAVLSRHPLVETYGDAPPEAGGYGATLASLKAATRSTSGR
ncbi:MAG: Smr/MutS family protein [Deltaproteobacteria bacterium]|nr:Smr/MutS family protein [Deltaproteobacteria bacterium]